DVHHGNGTQDIFYDDPTVFFFSTHQSSWYPGTGAESETGDGKGKGTTFNAPFAAGTGMPKIHQAFEQFADRMDAFKPDFLILSAGFDSRENDPLGDFKLTDADFAALTRFLMDLAETHCSGKLLSLLEGGYNQQGLASAVSSHVKTLTSG
ncbi:MAG: histone deacetylase, partial [Verrucomicrobiota bacterium]